MLHSYTVVLVVPDFLSDTYGQEHYTARVTLTQEPADQDSAIDAAIEMARREAMSEYEYEYDNADSWYVVGVFPGILPNLDFLR